MENLIEAGENNRTGTRFGQIAVQMGFATEDQLKDALLEQIANIPWVRLRPHRLIGEIFFQKGWMTLKQIDVVLNELTKDDLIKV